MNRAKEVVETADDVKSDSVQTRRVKRRSEKTAELRQHILDVALELFIEQGYDKTTTRQIVHKAGILNGSLYNIFKNKEEIFSEAILEVFWDAIEACERYLPDATILEKVGFPMLLPVYVSSKSTRFAELLAVASKKWETMEKIADFMKDWIEEKDSRQLFATQANNFRFLMYASLGAQGNILELYSRNPGAVDTYDAMKAVAVVMLNVFELPHTDTDVAVGRIYDAFRNNEITICGIRI